MFNLLTSKIYRVPTGDIFGLESDILAEATAGLGTVRIYGEGGAQFRIGEGLASDFGTARLRPGMGGGDAFRRVQPFAWYVFAGGDGQVVGRDITAFILGHSQLS